MDRIDSRPRVVIACPGLDRVSRGFETLARECFEALRAEGSLDVSLIKGSGEPGEGELVAKTVHRGSMPARLGGRLLRRGAYDVEQIGFVVAMLPLLARLRPDVVCISDLLTSRALARLRARTGWRFRLVVSNGGPWPSELLQHADHVQQLAPPALALTLQSGDPPERNTLLPLGVAMPAELDRPSSDDRRLLRQALGLPADRRILLSVGAVNSYDKRMDWLLEEVEAVPAPRPFVVLLGAQEEQTPAIRSLARSRLGDSGFAIATVPSSKVPDYYRAADLFALASLVESFGRVMVEAMSHGLPCLVHDGPVQRYLLGLHGFFGDFRRRGELARLVSERGERDLARGVAIERHRFVHERFSWHALTPRYASLLRECAR